MYTLRRLEQVVLEELYCSGFTVARCSLETRVRVPQVDLSL